MSRYVQVQYTPPEGVQGPRFDNIIPRSGRVWKGPGSVLAIPEDEAFHYLAHDGIFKRVGFQAVEHELVRDANDQATVDLLCGYLSVLSRDSLNRVIEAARGLLAEPEAPVTPPVGDLSNVNDIKATEKRIRKIFQTVDGLDVTGDNYDLRTNKPLLSAVQRHCNEKNITQRELDAAWALKKRAM